MLALLPLKSMATNLSFKDLISERWPDLEIYPFQLVSGMAEVISSHL